MTDDRRDDRGWMERVADLFSGEPTSRQDLMETIREAAKRQLVDAEAVNIMFGALQVAEMQAREIMIPRSQLVYLRADATPEEFLPVIIESQHSRFPVIGDDLDDIKGIIHAKDLLPWLNAADLGDFVMKDCIRPAPVIPESKRLNVLLTEFRKNRNHMAVVIDEYGNVAGAVTIEDVLEQIVGEIEDEHDANDESYLKQLEDGTWTVKATTPIEDFNEAFGADFKDDEFDTIGGIVMQRFRRLPRRGEKLRIGRFRFTVLNADSRRIRLLQLDVDEAHDPDAAPHTSADGSASG